MQVESEAKKFNRFHRAAVVVLGFALILVAWWAAESKRTTYREEERQGSQTLVIPLPRITATLVRPDEARPPWSDVIFQINFGEKSPGGQMITARFRWVDDEGERWKPAPMVRLIGRQDETVEGRIERVLTIAVTVPGLGRPPTTLCRDLGTADFLRWANALCLWSNAVLRLTVTDSLEPTALPALDQEFELRVSNKAASASLALAAVLLCLGALFIIQRVTHRSQDSGASVRSIWLGDLPRISPAHFQLVLSTLLAAYAVVYFIGLTGTLQTIPSGVLATLGIIAATCITAQLLLKQEQAEKDMGDLGLSARSGIYDFILGEGPTQPIRALMFITTLVGAAWFIGNMAVADRMPTVPAWALAMLGLTNAIYLVAGFTSLSMLRQFTASQKIGDEIVRGVQAVMLGPDATRYDGFARLSLARKELPFSWRVTLDFVTKNADDREWLPITIKEGQSAENVFFSIVARSDDPGVPEIDRDVTVPTDGCHEASFEIQFSSAGTWHIWVTIFQANRMVQILQAEATVPSCPSSTSDGMVGP